jgi:hypothetical protein
MLKIKKIMMQSWHKRKTSLRNGCAAVAQTQNRMRSGCAIVAQTQNKHAKRLCHRCTDTKQACEAVVQPLHRYKTGAEEAVQWRHRYFASVRCVCAVFLQVFFDWGMPICSIGNFSFQFTFLNCSNLKSMRHINLLILFAWINTFAFGQLKITEDDRLEAEIIRSGIIHAPLPLDLERSNEYAGIKKKILARKPVDSSQKEMEEWKHSGLGRVEIYSGNASDNSGEMKMIFPTFTGVRAVGSPDDKDYAVYGYCRVEKAMKGENWERYNRIAFDIYPDCEGARVVNLNFTFENENTPHRKGTNRRSASHLINLQNRKWNHCYLDLEEFQRDKVMRIGFNCSVKGRDRTSGDSSIYIISKIELQNIENPDQVSGWVPAKDRIAYSTSGYQINETKNAITGISNNEKDMPLTFRLIDISTDKIAFESNIQRRKTSLGDFGILDFTSFNKPGKYILEYGKTATQPFPIGMNIWENSMWRVLNFIFCQRCGYSVPGKHGICHQDLCSEHDGRKISYSGGWHDAGDLSQQTLQTGDVVYALLELHEKQRGKNELLSRRALEEAEWGLEFILRNRYGDGYRASSVGLLIWQDGIFGTTDDINSVRVQNISFDNFLYSAYEAYAALTINTDLPLQEYLKKTAKEDFAFAVKKHEESGFGGFIYKYEHSYNTSESQYYATISWAASMLFMLTKERYYADMAAENIRYVLSCQRTEPLNDNNGTRGFFYRNKSKQSIVHYIHQSREQIYMQAMTLLCKTQPNHPDYKLWNESVKLYSGYIKSLMQYTEPYGMLPSGVYNINEYKDAESFKYLHLFPPDNAHSMYIEQLHKGVKLDAEHYLKRFPVWFDIFNGNTAVHLSMGKAAAVCGHFLNDEELLRIGKKQMEWVAGKNPFGQSLIYGEGSNYPQMDSFSSGEITGEIPVGIRTLNNEDIPYWPQVNNACYKEVWVTSAGKWLSLQSEY